MKTTEPIPVDERPLSRDILDAVRYYLRGRTGMLVLVGTLVLAGMVLNWSWLVAIGVAPLLIALAPCAVMCALGLCAARMTGQSCASQSNAEQVEAPVRTVAKTHSAGLPAAAAGQRKTPARPKRTTGKSAIARKSSGKPSTAKRKSSSAAAASVDPKVVPIMPPVAVHDTGPGQPAEAETLKVDDTDGEARRGAPEITADSDRVVLTSSDTSRERS